MLLIKGNMDVFLFIESNFNIKNFTNALQVKIIEKSKSEIKNHKFVMFTLKCFFNLYQNIKV